MTSEVALFIAAWLCLALATGLMIGAAFALGSDDDDRRDREDAEVEMLDSWWEEAA